jgi:hypothetical protein
MPIDPVTGWGIVKTAGEVTRKLYEIVKEVKDREVKEKIDGVLDELRELKNQASELEDQNRELREKLRFKSDEFEFKTPFWYEKAHPDQPLCAKCFTDQKIAHVAVKRNEDGEFGRCLHCGAYIEVNRIVRRNPGPYEGGTWT